jgi:hypothetical protein
MRMRMRRRLFALAAASVVIGFATPASAQLHWDAGAQVGVMKRFLGARTISGDAGFGPMLELEGHVALLPLVRVGLYVGHDISPMPDPIAARDLTWGGLHVKIMSPVPSGDVRMWLFTGFGYSAVYGRSFPRTVQIPSGLPGKSTPADGTVQGAGGGYFQVPIGIGASYKLRKSIELIATLGVQIGFAFSGSLYEDPGPQLHVAGRPDDNVAPAGKDQYGLGLAVGILLDL